MATFSVREVEGMRQVRIDIRDETVRARRGAMSNMRGAITLTPRLPRAGDVFRSLFTSEARVRPFYTGTGSILLQPSLGGYHVLDVAEGEPLDPRARRLLGVRGQRRARALPRAVLGEPLGRRRLPGVEDDGRGPRPVAINAPGPVETVDVADGELRVQGRLVLGRTAGLGFASERSAPFPRNLISGQRRLRVYRRHRAGAGLLDALLERAPLQADDRREHRGLALRVARRPLTSRARGAP